MRFPEFKAIDVLDGGDTTGAVIFLHGAGFTGAQTRDHMEEMLEGSLAGMSFPSHVKIYFPTAPERFVKIRDKVMISWFDAERTGSRLEDVAPNYDDCEEAADYVVELIKNVEASGIPRNRIALAGLSQGGMLAQYVAFTRAKDIAGVLTMASVFPFVKAKMLKPPLPPLTQLYGLKDPVIPLKGIQLAELFLRSHGVQNTLRTLPDSTHELDEHYLKQFIQWIEKTIPVL